MHENMITSQAQSYVDLGLPSGTMWKSSNERHPSYNGYAFLTEDEMVSLFGGHFFRNMDWEEVEQECIGWYWTGSGYRVTGPNGNSIILPASDYCPRYGRFYCMGFYGGIRSDAPNMGNFEYAFFSYDLAVALFCNNIHHLPSISQWQELQDNCRWLWTNNGYKVTGSNGNSIFLPALGSRGDNGHFWPSGCSGCYWSSVQRDKWDVYYYGIGSEVHHLFYTSRQMGHSVRLVQDQ